MKNKFNNGYYVVAFIIGLSSGLGLAKFAYNKGRKDAYEEVNQHLNNIVVDEESV